MSRADEVRGRVRQASTGVRRVLQVARQVGPVATFASRRVRGAKSPLQMTLSLTNRCNFKCEYCDIPLQRRAEMTLGEWCAAVDELRAGGMGRVSLIGGEPLLFEPVDGVIDHLRERGIHTAMNTNGWFVEERRRDVAKLDLVCVTLDGPRAVHDAQRRRGSFDRAVRALEVLHELGVPAVTMSVLTPATARHLTDVLQIARDMGHRAFFQLEHDKGCDVMAPIAPRLRIETIGEIARELTRLKRDGFPVGNSYSILERQAAGGRYLGGCDTCYAGRYYGYVFSDGTVAPCLLTQAQVERENGRRQGFVEAFQTLAAPRGPGCSCVPTHQVNAVLAFDSSVLFDALGMVVGAARGAQSERAPAL